MYSLKIKIRIYLEYLEFSLPGKKLWIVDSQFHKDESYTFWIQLQK